MYQVYFSAVQARRLSFLHCKHSSHRALVQLYKVAASSIDDLFPVFLGGRSIGAHNCCCRYISTLSADGTVYVLQSYAFAWISPVTFVPRLPQLRSAPPSAQIALGVFTACHTGTCPVLRAYAIDDATPNCAGSIPHRLLVRVCYDGVLEYRCATPGCPHFETRAIYRQRPKPGSPALYFAAATDVPIFDACKYRDCCSYVTVLHTLLHQRHQVSLRTAQGSIRDAHLPPEYRQRGSHLSRYPEDETGGEMVGVPAAVFVSDVSVAEVLVPVNAYTVTLVVIECAPSVQGGEHPLS